MKTWKLLNMACAVALSVAITHADENAAARKVAAAGVKVGFRFQTVDDEVPLNRVRGERCENCGRFHSSRLENGIKCEKSWWLRGVLVAPDTVLCEDVTMAPEYVAAITVQLGDETRKATVEKIFLDRSAMALRLAEPFKAAGVPIEKRAGEPVTAMTFSSVNNESETRVAITPLAGRWGYTTDGSMTLSLPASAVLLDKKNRVCGYMFGRRWSKGEPVDPAAWRTCTEQELKARMTATQQALEQSVYPVTLHFRSPKAPRVGLGSNSYSYRRFSRSDENENASQTESIGIQVTGRRLLVPTTRRKVDYERLERIMVTLPGAAEPVEARFVCALKRLSAMVVELPAERPVKLFDPKGTAPEDQLLTAAVVSSAGTSKLRVQVVPVRMPQVGYTSYDMRHAEVSLDTNKRDCFLFTEAMQCQWWPASLLPRVRVASRYSFRSDSDGEEAMLAADVARLFAEPGEDEIDPSLKPAPPEEENAIGWLGLELQSIGARLAEAKGVVAETESGRYGGLVTQVQPDSPATAAGVKPDWVLLSITPLGEKVPVRIEISDDEGRYGRAFEWDQLANIPPQYVDHLPLPWPSVDTPLATQLTMLGIGTEVTAAFLVDGKRVEKTMKIERGPLHYGNSPMVKWEGAGISVCDLTYEVREYLNLAKDAPGVVVCRVETGSSAVMAGIRPFEVITQINGAVIKSVEDVRKFIDSLDEMRLNVTRMTTDRVVTFKPKTKEEVEADRRRAAPPEP